MTLPKDRQTSRKGFSISARLKSFRYAIRGLRVLVREEHNARVHLAASLCAVAVGAVLRLSSAEWRWLVLAIALVWLAEAFNTAIEDLCDRICPDFDPAIGRIKDLAAGGVLVATLAAAAIGVFTLGPPLLRALT
ncbi:diacylglycerol kinase family protein [Sphingomonas sp. TDK1]|uniref:diacylglycerol kinase family protein n=1 Tax=Sphingomonas sp. TDK1 TaxID=453247 RepID=UPI0007D8E6B0|nr:diacylglycerol kinase family protein [Sphingomonas sp. TDK1]OAN58325.1 diacylglycerol kinase [Sphingomonas sp. TDK1]